MGKLLYEQYVSQTSQATHCLAWDELPIIARQAWNNVWLTSVEHCKLSISEVFEFHDNHTDVMESIILNALDNLI